jgi:hypothetical protein
LNLVLVLSDCLASVLKFIVTRLGLSSGQVWSCLEGILVYPGTIWGHVGLSEGHFESCWAEWACTDAMLWLSGQPLGPYWRGMGVKVWEMPHGLEV